MVGLDCLDVEVFLCYVGWLGGCDIDEIVGSLLLLYVWLVVSVYYVCELCCLDGIVVMLVYFFGVLVCFEEFVLYWIVVDFDEFF